VPLAATKPAPEPVPADPWRPDPHDLLIDLLCQCRRYRHEHPEVEVSEIADCLNAAARWVADGALDRADEIAAEDVPWEKSGRLDESQMLVLTPSDRPGYTHYVVIDVATGEVVGPKRPIRDDALEMAVTETYGVPMPTRWTYKRSSKRHRENPYLIGSEPVLTREQQASVFAEREP
jgi:hypothetical protein